jgi:hypothetical protein
MVRKKGPSLVTNNLKDVLKSVCPGCKMEVEESTGIRSDLCKSHSHISCMDVASEEAQLLLRIHRRFSHLKLLCLNCDGVFQYSPLSPIDPTVPLEDNLFLKYVRNIVVFFLITLYIGCNCFPKIGKTIIFFFFGLSFT